MEIKSVALLGLGTMGAGMAKNLLKAGFPLTVYNRTRARAEPFADLGARVASTPAAVAAGAHVIVSMLSDNAASREAWVGENGAMQAAAPGTILIESSTVSPVWIAELSDLASASKLELLDAPVTGSRAQAEGGQLNFLVGGNESALTQVMAVFQAMGKSITYLGPTGSGAKLKLINNFLCGVQAASLAEGLAWLERSGLDVDKSLEILKGGAPGSPLFSALSTRMTKRDYTVNFYLNLMAKDLQYAHTAAAETGIDLSTAANAQVLFQTALQLGYGEQDMASVVEPLRSTGQR